MTLITLIAIFIVFVFLFSAYKIIDKILMVEREKITHPKGKTIQLWGRRFLNVVGIIILGSWILYRNDLEVYYIMSVIFFIFGFQAVTEFIFIKNSKQYISTIIFLIIFLITMFLLLGHPAWVTPYYEFWLKYI